MCDFSYYIYSGCKHRVIEITSYCQQTLWKAGLTGTLETCQEAIYRETMLNFRVSKLQQKNAKQAKAKAEYWWEGLSGFCRKCEDEYKMPKVAHHSTNDGGPITICQRKPIDQDPATTAKANPTPMATPARKHMIPPSSFDPTYDPFYNPLRPVYESVVEKPKLDHPFISIPYINRTVYSLLDIIDEYDAKTSKLPYYFYFPPNFELYDPEVKSEWSSRAHYMSVPWLGPPNPYLTANGGLTKADKAYIKDSMSFMEDPFLIYKREFRCRGMDYKTFRAHHKKPEVLPSMI